MTDFCAEVLSLATHLCCCAEKLNSSLVIGQILVSASGTSGSLSLEDGNAFPYNVSKGCILEPSSPITLHNLIETAGDLTQSDFSFTLLGTEFGNAVNPMPTTFNFTATGYNCSVPKNYSK